MVLESLTNPYNAEAHPAAVAMHGAIYAIIALFLSLYLFPEYASIVTVFLIVGASIPLLYNLIKYEEDKDFEGLEEKILIKEHGKALQAYFMLFIGVTLALAGAFLLLTALAGVTINIAGITSIHVPDDIVVDAFDAQIRTYQSINPNEEITGQATGGAYFAAIFLNNLQVLVWSILFSFLYGAGAIFVLTWNASVIALAIGNTIRTKIGSLASEAGFPTLAAYLGVGSKTIFLRYGIHGSLEILAYMIAGLAGGIISVAVIRHHHKTKKFEHIIIDSVDLILLSIAVLFLAASVETWITPIFY